MRTLIKNATLVNEGTCFVGDLVINNHRIEKISTSLTCENATILDAEGLYLIPGMIDDQVHFREPGLTHKGTIRSESMAAVAGGITSFMDMPNTLPHVLNLALLEEKYAIAKKDSMANYSFFMGINQNNLEDALRIDNRLICGITDDGLYFDTKGGLMCNQHDYLEKLFSRCDSLIALHCEVESEIDHQKQVYEQKFGVDIPPKYHALIRSEKACFEATRGVVELAKKHKNRVHIFHVSTLKETELFDDLPLASKRITGEACIHHLYFNDRDYDSKGSLIQWNPSIKTEKDRIGLLNGLKNGRIDFIATDHAPHSLKEKKGRYNEIHSGAPLVQHALPALLNLVSRGELTLTELVQFTSHNVATAYRMENRGFLREGYFADLVLLKMNDPWTENHKNLAYHCGWSPFFNERFMNRVVCTFVNGEIAYKEGKWNERCLGMRLTFNKDRN